MSFAFKEWNRPRFDRLFSCVYSELALSPVSWATHSQIHRAFPRPGHLVDLLSGFSFCSDHQPPGGVRRMMMLRVGLVGLVFDACACNANMYIGPRVHEMIALWCCICIVLGIKKIS